MKKFERNGVELFLCVKTSVKFKMLENSRKRSRKSKLELREGVDLEDNSFLYAQFEKQNKENESLIPANLMVKEEKCTDIEADKEVKNVESTSTDQKPSMEFSVKVEVEECDAAPSDDNHAITMAAEDKTPKTLDDVTTEVQTVDTSTSSVFVVTAGKSNTEVTKKDVIKEKLNESMSEVKKKDLTSDKDYKIFREYTTHKAKVLRISNFLHQSDNFADRALSIETLNYMGRVLDEPKGIFFQNVLQEWNDWHQLHSAVRDSPLLYKCYVCGESFWHLHDFREHVPTHQKYIDQYTLTIETANDECFLVYTHYSIKKDLKYPDGDCLKCHKSAESHTFAKNVKNYKCIACKVTFSTCSQLYMHEMKCTVYKNEFVPKGDIVQECRICQSGFYTDSTLMDHLNTHHVVRSDVVTPWEALVCSLCNRSFILPALHICLKKTNNYGCNYCGRSFQKKVFKELHVKNNHKPFQCRICDKSLMAVCMEPSHFLQHTERFALMYKCIECVSGRYYPDEHSITHHTEFVHKRKFEKKFKYLEMVILPKQCLDKVIQDLPSSATANKRQQAPMKVTSGPTHKHTEPALPQPIQTPQYHINVVIKDEPVEDNVVASVQVEPMEIKKESVDPASCIRITDITSLNELLNMNTETEKPEEEGPEVSEDVVIVESKSEVLSLSSSEDSDDSAEYKGRGRKKYTGPKRKRLAKYSCKCGYVATKSKMKAHRQRCIAVLALMRLRASRRAGRGLPAGGDKSNGSNAESAKRRLRPARPTTASDSGGESQGDATDSAGEGKLLPKRGRPAVNAVYKCPCGFRAEFAQLKRHQVDCEGYYSSLQPGKRQAVTCGKCATTFDNLYRYASHFSRAHGLHRFACPRCGVRFETLHALVSDITRHVRRQFVKITSITERLDGAKYSVCTKCHVRCKPEEMLAHWEDHLELPDGKAVVAREGSPEGPSLEDQRGSLFSQKELEDALAALQKTPSTLESRSEARACVICARRFARVNDCKRHTVEHLLADAFNTKRPNGGLRCQICSTVLPKADSYKQHMREHAALPLYQCEVCSKSFSDSSNFCKHKKVHNLATLGCGICEKKFHNAACLQKHMEMHNTTKPKFCGHCARVFYTESSFKKHVSSHEKKITFRCAICRESFARLKDKWDHMWMVHEERQVIADCPLCDHSFRRFADVKSHVRSAHNRAIQRDPNGGVVLTCTTYNPRSCTCCPPKQQRRGRLRPSLGDRGIGTDSDSEQDQPTEDDSMTVTVTEVASSSSTSELVMDVPDVSNECSVECADVNGRSVPSSGYVAEFMDFVLEGGQSR